MTDREPDADLLAAALAFLPDMTGTRKLAGRSSLVRVEHPGGMAVVRRLPDRMTPERAAIGPAVMRALAGVAPVPAPLALPDGKLTLTLREHRYEARTWLPGETIARNAVAYPDPEVWVNLPGILPDASFGETLAALARIHGATEGARGLPMLPAAPLDGLAGAVRGAWMDARARLRPVIHLHPAAQRWVAASERALPAAEATLAAAGLETLAPSAAVHQNLWPGHVALDGDRLAGLLGWDQVAYGTPLLDVAQAAVRLRGWSAATVEETVAGYGAERVLGPEERRALPALAAFDLVAIAGRLLVAAYAPWENAPAPPTALKQAAARMVEGLENATNSMAAMESPRTTGRLAGAQRRRRPMQGPGTRSRR
ncbi:MAG: phosphotransferase [Thermomicrobiales bacterium]